MAGQKSLKMSRDILNRWVWLKLRLFPVYVAEMRGQKVRVIFSDFSGADSWRSVLEVVAFATKQEVVRELRSAIKQIKDHWPN